MSNIDITNVSPDVLALLILYFTFKLIIYIAFGIYMPALIAYFYRKFNLVPWSYRLQEDEKKWNNEINN